MAIQFRAVPREDLSSAERQTFQTNRDAGRHLRNINLVNTSWADSTLDIEIDRPMQETWVNDGVQEPPDDPRTQRAMRRLRTRPKYEALRAHPHFDAILADLVTYVGKCIIWPSTNAEERWTITAMPTTSRTKEMQRLLTVNCGLVEVFVVFEDRQTHDAWWFLNVDSDEFDPAVLPSDLREMYEVTDNYRCVGLVGQVYGAAAGNLEAWFDETPNLEKAARSLALGLMRKQPAMFAKYYCDDLVDEILVNLAKQV